MHAVPTIEFELCIDAGPWAADHFPGNPIIPGAVLLDEISAAMRAACPQFGALTSIVQARFLQPVRPPARLQIQAQWTAPRVDFTVVDRATGEPAMRGRFRFAAPSQVGGA